MALLDNRLKQRMVGALVLLALAVIFLPMLLSRENDLRQVSVQPPPMPRMPEPPKIEMVPAPVPQPLPDEPVPPPPGIPADDGQAAAAAAPEQTSPASPSPSAPPAGAAGSRLDVNGLPVSWSVQLASLSSRSGAENLQKTLRSQGYNAYIRSIDGMNRVFVGPVIERAEADRLRDQLNRQQKLNGFVVRFKPENG
jgi:DedD protein